MTASLAELQEKLQEEVRLMADFLALAQQEQEAIQSGTAEVLDQLTPRKLELVTALNGAANGRNQWLTSHGFGEDKVGVEAALRAQASPACGAAWEELKSLTAQAKETNSLNGKLLGMWMQHNNQALDILLSATGHSKLYGPDGHPDQLADRRIIDSV